MRIILYRYKIVFLLLFLTITIATIPILINESISQAPGVTPIDPENVTNQTLQGYPAEDKDMSTGIGNNK
jgi:hypothetical protein